MKTSTRAVRAVNASAALAFDGDGNLWVQQYVDHSDPSPAGRDCVVRIDRADLAAGPSFEHFTYYPVETRDTVMHRIIDGPDGNLWFTELNSNKVGRLVYAPGRAAR